MTDASLHARGSDATSGSRVVFIHIPKTAGTTLNHVLRVNASQPARLGNVFKGKGGHLKEPQYEQMVAKMRAKDDARLFWGHTPFAIASFMPPEWQTRFITFLRDPVERAISHYYHLVERLDRLDLDGDEGLADSERADVEPRHRPPKDKVIRGELVREVSFEVALTDTAYVSDNLQTRMLCGLPKPFDEVTDEMFERAVENLGRFRCVGLTERFDESLVLLKRRIGYDNILYQDQRVNSSRPHGDDVPAELRRAAEEANRYDVELYGQAAALFDGAPELGDLEFQVDLAALRSSRGGDTALLNGPPAGLPTEGASWADLVSDRRALMEEQRDRMRRRLDETRREKSKVTSSPTLGECDTEAPTPGRVNKRPKRERDRGDVAARQARRAQRAGAIGSADSPD